MTWKQQEFIITMWCPPPATDEHYGTLDNLGKKAELDALIETLKAHPAFEGKAV